MKIDICIVDDSKSDLGLIQNTVKQILGECIGKLKIFDNPNNPEILESSFDVYLLDIDMPYRNGFQIAEELNLKSPISKIVFVSMREDLVFDSLRYNSIYFVRKSCLNNDIQFALKKIVEYFGRIKKEYIYNKGNIIVKIPYYKICYIEVNHNTLTIQTSDQIYHERKSIRSMLNELNDDDFFQPHNSFIVNLLHVTAYRNEFLYLDNQDRIPVASRLRKRTETVYKQYLLRKA